MIIYENSVAGFIEDTTTHEIQDLIHARFTQETGKSVSEMEVRSWENSLVKMMRVLKCDEIPGDCGLAIEYTIPQTGKRVDVLLTGLDEKNDPHIVIVELKQWSEASATPMDGIVKTRFKGGMADTSHPSYQAWSYAELLRGFNEAVYTASIQLHPCAYLHNFGSPEGAIFDPHYQEYLDRAPIFVKGDDQKNKLQQFISTYLKIGDAGKTLYEIENSRIRPSKNLAEVVGSMIDGNPEFVLIDDQKVVYEAALAAAESMEAGKKRVVVVTGGPGTGKSVVAVNLLTELTRRRLTARYVTKNAAPRAVYESQLTGMMTKSRISHMFTGSGSFMHTEENAYDALVVDEAHRLNAGSGFYGNEGDRQAKEIIQSARCSIFFLDEDQRVTMKDVGSRHEILRFANECDAEIVELELASQFRCNGSNGYLAWLDSTLGIRETANTILSPDDFDFQVMDSPRELHERITALNEERNKARMVAGYCWNWITKKDPDAYDIEISDHDYRARWNLQKDGNLWIISPESVSEVGCIHTSQGLEVDFVGVIIGDDLVVEGGEIRTQPEQRARTDQSLKGWKKKLKEDKEGTLAEVDLLIKNTYRTLLTRGMKGCYVYCTDSKLREFLRKRIATR